MNTVSIKRFIKDSFARIDAKGAESFLRFRDSEVQETKADGHWHNWRRNQKVARLKAIHQPSEHFGADSVGPMLDREDLNNQVDEYQVKTQDEKNIFINFVGHMAQNLSRRIKWLIEALIQGELMQAGTYAAPMAAETSEGLVFDKTVSDLGNDYGIHSKRDNGDIESMRFLIGPSNDLKQIRLFNKQEGQNGQDLSIDYQGSGHSHLPVAIENRDGIKIEFKLD
ncbi:MAG: hypothetical protein OXU45_01850 [Candidatus Melainabacteria bacterium]|nr:hypothetical protein [Candidatus Melainabacteria bacterium]